MNVKPPGAKYFLINFGLSVVILLTGVSILVYLMKGNRLELRRQIAILMARMVDVPSQPQSKSLQSLDQALRDLPWLALHTWLADSNGRILDRNTSDPLPECIANQALPTAVNEYRDCTRSSWTDATAGVIRLKGEPPRFLFFSREGSVRSHSSRAAAIRILTTLLVIFAGISAAGLLFFAYLRARAGEAEKILSRLRSGELGARFRIQKTDEIGQLMLQFNGMADEIERLFLELQRKEKTRIEILQELGHDLRTPLTSMQNLIDALDRNRKSMGEAAQTECFLLLSRELKYMKRLLDDLFLLAQLDGPAFPSTSQQVENVEMGSVIEAEIQSVQRLVVARKNVTFQNQHRDRRSWVKGDPTLLSRLIRNALQNAARFASAQVLVQQKEDADCLEIRISDDGPGFSEEGLKRFGTRAQQRSLEPSSSGEISLGLGSFIMKRIADSLGGSVHAENRKSSGRIEGATVSISLPITKAGPL